MPTADSPESNTVAKKLFAAESAIVTGEADNPITEADELKIVPPFEVAIPKTKSFTLARAGSEPVDMLLFPKSPCVCPEPTTVPSNAAVP